jgi:heme/copper-type cytochrome/quinol oxidase subunit 1
MIFFLVMPVNDWRICVTVFVPLMIAAPDYAFPRLNNISF